MADAILAASGIYIIKNASNNKVYVGSAVNANSRWRTHRSLLNRGVHPNVKLQRAWAKYGISSFEFSVVEFVSDKTDLICREQAWIDKLDAASKRNYNVLAKAGSSLGYRHTEESNAQRSAALKGRPRAPEVVARMGRKNSIETIEKRRASLTGKKRSPEIVAKMRLLSPTQEQRARISAALKGRKLAPEIVEKIRAASTGRKISPEAIARRVAAFHETIKARHAAKAAAK